MMGQHAPSSEDYLRARRNGRLESRDDISHIKYVQRHIYKVTVLLNGVLADMDYELRQLEIFKAMLEKGLIYRPTPSRALLTTVLPICACGRGTGLDKAHISHFLALSARPLLLRHVRVALVTACWQGQCHHARLDYDSLDFD